MTIDEPTITSAGSGPDRDRARMEPIVAFITERHPDAGPVGWEDDLIEARLVDSLDFVELVFLVEHLTGTEVVLEEVDVASFRSLRAMHDAFF